jgi:hypothetical protein
MKSLNEELNRMKGLMNFDISQNSHDVLSEQLFDKDRRKFRKAKRKSKKSRGDGNITINSSQANWGGGNKGNVYLPLEEKGLPAAFNIGEERGMIIGAESSNFIVAKDKFDPPVYTAYTDDPGYTIDEFNVGEILDVYSDNMVMPRLKNASVLDEFNNIVNQFVEYINAGGLDKLNNVTIQGQADSANPTWDVPSGYNKLDHKYGGIKKKSQSEYTDDELDEMNTFLARERAFNFKMALINAIKEQTGKKIEIKELTPINHRGQDGKRGGKYRSILLKPNAPIHKVIFTDPEKKKEYGEIVRKKKEREEIVKSGLYPAKVAFNVNGKYQFVPAISEDSTTQESKKIVNVYVNIQPGSGNRYKETKVFVRSEIVNELNFGKENSTVLLTNVNCTRDKMVVNAGRGDITMNIDQGIKGKSAVVNMLYNTPGINGETTFFNNASGDRYTAYGQPLTYTTNEIKKIDGKTYFRVKNIWFAFATSPTFGRDLPLINGSKSFSVEENLRNEN